MGSTSGRVFEFVLSLGESGIDRSPRNWEELARVRDVRKERLTRYKAKGTSQVPVMRRGGEWRVAILGIRMGEGIDIVVERFVDWKFG